MKQRLFCLIALLPFFATAQTQWSQAPLQLPTRWSKLVTPENALIEYPRPQMVRANWTNLKRTLGLRNYGEGCCTTPSHFDGKNSGSLSNRISFIRSEEIIASFRRIFGTEKILI